MASLTSLEKRRFEDLLNMASGYVLDFTNNSFAEFMRENAKRDIYDTRFAYNGDSKAKRLRAFWEIEDDQAVGSVLEALLDLWQYQNDSKPDPANRKTYEACRETVSRLLGRPKCEEVSEQYFLKMDFGHISLNGLNLQPALVSILEARIKEASASLRNDAPLSSIFMSGSVLEGLLLSMALNSPQSFNQASASPKDPKTGKVKPFHEWKLGELIDVSYELGIIRLDVKKFSHALREFRNYIHPYQQMSSGFAPDKNTSRICFQVLRAAIDGLHKSK